MAASGVVVVIMERIMGLGGKSSRFPMEENTGNGENQFQNKAPASQTNLIAGICVWRTRRWSVIVY